MRMIIEIRPESGINTDYSGKIRILDGLMIREDITRTYISARELLQFIRYRMKAGRGMSHKALIKYLSEATHYSGPICNAKVRTIIELSQKLQRKAAREGRTNI